MFENDVKGYGFQTVTALSMGKNLFENDVKGYGFQTDQFQIPHTF